jgi:hypothetical protein
MTAQAAPHRNAHHSTNGTWMEPEELCYPGGGMHRRCRAIFPDGKARIVKAGIPDTAFSVPAKHSAMGSGFIDHKEGEGYTFHPRKPRMPVENSAIANTVSALSEAALVRKRTLPENTEPTGRHLRWHQTGYAWKDGDDTPDEPEEEKDEGHHPCEPEDGDDRSAVDIAVDHLKDAGVQHASSSHWHPRMWYSTEPDQDFRSGVYREKTFHPTGFSHDEQKEIAKRMAHTGVKVL